MNNKYTRRLSLYPEMLVRLQGFVAFLERFQNLLPEAKHYIDKGNEIIAKCEEGENNDATKS